MNRAGLDIPRLAHPALRDRKQGLTMRRGFTLLELMLAVVLGAMVMSTALGIFISLQRSDRVNEQRLQSTMELSLTHGAIERALRSMVLAPGEPPRTTQTPATPGTNIARLIENAAPVEQSTEYFPRVILTSNAAGPVMRWVDEKGQAFPLQAQRLEVVLERPPVFAEPEPGEQFVPVVRRTYANRHQRERENRRRERDERREDRIGEEDSGSGENPFDETEPAVAAGVRGVFELTFEPDQRRPGDLPLPEGGSWTLWWRTLPPLTDATDTEGLTPEEIDADPMYRRVKLASHLRWCRWEAVREKETLSEFETTWWQQLPAYITLEIKTVSGKWSKWMFEVNGTRGQEPGTLIGVPSSPEVTPEEALDRLGEQDGGSGSGTGGPGAPSRRLGPEGSRGR